MRLNLGQHDPGCFERAEEADESSRERLDGKTRDRMLYFQAEMHRSRFFTFQEHINRL